MPIGYEKVYENKFTTETQEFTVSNISDYGFLHILFSFDLRSSSSSDNAIFLYPNNDTLANYSTIGFYFTSAGYGRSTSPSANNMVLCRVGWRRRNLCDGTADVYTRVTGYWRSILTRFTMQPIDHIYYGAEERVGYWKDTTSTINSIVFKTFQSGYGFTGWIKVYGLKI